MKKSVIVASMLIAMSVPTANAAFNLDEAGKVKLYGDFRARYENDWDSTKSNGTMRSDRERLRFRLRAGIKYQPNNVFSFDARLRSGSDDSQQSPHITFHDMDDNSTGDHDYNLDKWYVKANKDKLWGWVGRNGMPFWKQNELYWDDDVTLAGIAVGYKTTLGNDKLSFNGGYFNLPVGMHNYSGDMVAGQVVYGTTMANTKIKLAGGVLIIDADGSNAEGALLLNSNGSRDYTIWVGSLQAKLKAGSIPLTLGADILHNSEDYSSTDSNAFTAANYNETDGYILSAKLGGLKNPGDWLGAYYYARIETLAVNSSYAGDDWVRWGSATETRGSNMKGHEFRAAYRLTKKINLVARYYKAEAITNQEDGERFRFDFNYKF